MAVATGLVTAFAQRFDGPTLVVSLGIAALKLGAAREVWEAARETASHRARGRAT